MKVKFDFTIDDMVDVAERAMSRSPLVRTWRWEGLATSCVLGAVVAYFVVGGSVERRLYGAIVGALVCALIYPFTVPRTRKARLQKYYREEFGGDGPYTCEVEITPAGLATVQAGLHALQEWPTIVAIHDTPDSVDFVGRGGRSLVVRNRAFRSPEERAEFIRLARSYANSGPRS
jgi:hypothetical protein